MAGRPAGMGGGEGTAFSCSADHLEVRLVLGSRGKPHFTFHCWKLLHETNMSSVSTVLGMAAETVTSGGQNLSVCSASHLLCHPGKLSHPHG